MSIIYPLHQVKGGFRTRVRDHINCNQVIQLVDDWFVGVCSSVCVCVCIFLFFFGGGPIIVSIYPCHQLKGGFTLGSMPKKLQSQAILLVENNTRDTGPRYENLKWSLMWHHFLVKSHAFPFKKILLLVQEINL